MLARPTTPKRHPDTAGCAFPDADTDGNGLLQCHEDVPFPGQGDLVFTEMMVRPATNDSQREYVEIYNTTNQRLKLAGLRLYACPNNNCSDKTNVITGANFCEFYPFDAADHPEGSTHISTSVSAPDNGLVDGFKDDYTIGPNEYLVIGDVHAPTAGVYYVVDIACESGLSLTNQDPDSIALGTPAGSGLYNISTVIDFVKFESNNDNW